MNASLAATVVLLAAARTVAASAAPLPPAATAGLTAIDACIARLDPGVDIGYERIAARCPDLARSLAGSSWSAWLPAGWNDANNDLSAGGLGELRALVTRELDRESSARRPHSERLGKYLDDLGQTAPRQDGLWARIKAWLRVAFETRQPDRSGDWLERMTRGVGLGQTVIELITYVGLAIIVALAGVIVTHELRAAQIMGRRRRRGAAQQPTRAPAGRAPPEWSQIERAPPGEQPRLLFELVVARLVEMRRLPPPAALTVHELLRSAELPAPEDRERLAQVALTAEHARYSGRLAAGAHLARAVQCAHELLERLVALRARDLRT